MKTDSLENLTKQGWESTSQRFNGLLILKKDSQRMLFDERTGEINTEWEEKTDEYHKAQVDEFHL